MISLRLAALALVAICAAEAQTCTPLNAPAVIEQGQTWQPAIFNGIDNVSYSSVRFQWTSDAATHVANYQRIVYATAAQYAANGGHIIGANPYSIWIGFNQTVTSSTAIQGMDVANLLTSTTYYIAGQSSTDGSTWCPEVDESFTTPAFTGVVHPTAPATFTITTPTVTGTDYTLGVSPCTDLQTCMNMVNPGDGIGIPPGSPAVLTTGVIPDRTSGYAATLSGSVFTSAHTFTNNQQVTIADNLTGYASAPFFCATVYSILCNPSGSTCTKFNLSLDGTNAVTATQADTGNIFITPYPNAQNYVLVHSTASSANLPPPGVRLDPVAYGPYLGKIQLSAPSTSNYNAVLNFSRISAYWYFKDIEFQTLPNAPGTQTDPYPYGYIAVVGPQADHIVFDQDWFHPAPPPDRMEAMIRLEGTNLAIVNSYADNAVIWAATRTPSTNSTTTSSTVTIPAHTYSFPVSGNTYSACTLSSNATLTFTGSSTPVYIYWTFPACVLTAQIQTGSTATGSAFSIVTAASPAWTVTAFNGPDGHPMATSLEIWSGTGGGGSVSGSDISQTGSASGGCCVMPNRFGTEWNTGINLGTNSPGPTIVSNNRIGGQEILFFKDDAALGVGYGGILTNTNNLILQRNTFVQEPYLLPGNAAYSGSYWAGRQPIEFKQGSRVLIDGNVISTFYASITSGSCMSLLNFLYAGAGLSAPQAATVNTADTSDYEISNNTCISTPADFQISGAHGNTQGAINPSNFRRRTWIHNNLLNQTNGYTYNHTPTYGQTYGLGAWIDTVESLDFSHNTYYKVGGSGGGTGGPSPNFHLSGGLSVRNNVLNYNSDNGNAPYLTYLNDLGSIPDPGSAVGSALLGRLNETTWANNVALCQWSNSNPASYAEISSSACSAAAGNYPSGDFWPSGSSLANRIAAIGWFSPGTDFHLKSSSPYISGGSNHASDGLDIGANIETLEAAQGKVSNVHVSALSATAANVTWLAPDSFACSLDYGTNNFTGGSGSWTRAGSTATGPGGVRVQTASLTGLTAGTSYNFRVNCAVMQPTGAFQTP